jgi:hypothetical protein
MAVFVGGCLCGQVRIAAQGVPKRIGVCHCTDCRQESGSAFTFFAVWAASQFESRGKTSEFSGRSYCSHCGSRLFSANKDEAEIKLGCLQDVPTELTPTYELWVKRRESWLSPIPGADQYDEDRT